MRNLNYIPIVLVAAAAPLLAACVQTSGNISSAPPPLPTDYRRMIVERIRKDFFDPYTIRDASLSQPISGSAITGPTISVCVRANAKNRMGGYTGQKETLFVFRDGQISLVDQEYSGLACTSAQYAHFPEIEEGYKPPQAR